MPFLQRSPPFFKQRVQAFIRRESPTSPEDFSNINSKRSSISSLSRQDPDRNRFAQLPSPLSQNPPFRNSDPIFGPFPPSTEQPHGFTAYNRLTNASKRQLSPLPPTPPPKDSSTLPNPSSKLGPTASSAHVPVSSVTAKTPDLSQALLPSNPPIIRGRLPICIWITIITIFNSGLITFTIGIVLAGNTHGKINIAAVALGGAGLVLMVGSAVIVACFVRARRKREQELLAEEGRADARGMRKGKGLGLDTGRRRFSTGAMRLRPSILGRTVTELPEWRLNDQVTELSVMSPPKSYRDRSHERGLEDRSDVPVLSSRRPSLRAFTRSWSRTRSGMDRATRTKNGRNPSSQTDRNMTHFLDLDESSSEENKKAQTGGTGQNRSYSQDPAVRNHEREANSPRDARLQHQRSIPMLPKVDKLERTPRKTEKDAIDENQLLTFEEMLQSQDEEDRAERKMPTNQPARIGSAYTQDDYDRRMQGIAVYTQSLNRLNHRGLLQAQRYVPHQEETQHLSWLAYRGRAEIAEALGSTSQLGVAHAEADVETFDSPTTQPAVPEQRDTRSTEDVENKGRKLLPMTDTSTAFDVAILDAEGTRPVTSPMTNLARPPPRLPSPILNTATSLPTLHRPSFYDSTLPSPRLSQTPPPELLSNRVYRPSPTFNTRDPERSAAAAELPVLTQIPPANDTGTLRSPNIIPILPSTPNNNSPQTPASSSPILPRSPRIPTSPLSAPSATLPETLPLDNPTALISPPYHPWPPLNMTTPTTTHTPTPAPFTTPTTTHPHLADSATVTTTIRKPSTTITPPLPPAFPSLPPLLLPRVYNPHAQFQRPMSEAPFERRSEEEEEEEEEEEGEEEEEEGEEVRERDGRVWGKRRERMGVRFGRGVEGQGEGEGVGSGE